MRHVFSISLFFAPSQESPSEHYNPGYTAIIQQQGLGSEWVGETKKRTRYGAFVDDCFPAHTTLHRVIRNRLVMQATVVG